MQCALCKSVFEIPETDQVFQKELRADIPPPTLCPACRSRQRLVHRNERSLWKRNCNLCKKNIIAMYSPDASFPVYCQECFWSDGWNALDHGKKYDPKRSFFEQYAELLASVPHLAIINKQSQNSDYCNYAYAQKNCYLTFGSHYEEDCLYEAYSTRNKSSMDFLWVYGSELMYESMFIRNCYGCIYLEHCENCNDCLFSRDLKGCKNCLFCANLHQKQYCIFNQQHSKEEYERKLKEYQIHTTSGFQKAKLAFQELSLKHPVRAVYQIQSENCEGSIHLQCNNMRQCFDCAESEDCAYGFQVDNTHDSQDIDYMGYDKTEHSYQLIGCLGLFECICCNACWQGSGLRYCQYCFSCNDCFGCVSLQQKKQCILNTQYSKEEYETLKKQIIEDMRKNKEWGSFFSAALSPFGYNESMANDWFPLSKEQALQQGYSWREKPQTVEAKKTVPANRLPDSIDEVPNDILNWAILCENSGKPFKIVEPELKFYRSMRLPIPHLHPEERHLQRTARRHPRKLWGKTCANCQKTMQTTFQPSRPEIVYCEQCYRKEIY